MKTKQTLTILLTLLLSFGTWSCEKDEKEKNWTSLPAETQEGKNTIGCLVDGKVWATNYWGNRHWMSKSTQVIYYKNSEKSYYIKILAYKKNDTAISIWILNKKIKIETKLNADFVFKNELGNYDAIRGMGGVYLTKFDTINRIISGKFSFEAIHEEDKTDTLKVTDGRFDMELIIDKN